MDVSRRAALLVTSAVLLHNSGAVAAPAPREPARLERVSVTPDGASPSGDSLHPAISGDGRFVAFESAAEDLVARDGNGRVDIFVFDRVSRTTEIVSVSSSGSSADDDSFNPQMSADGRYVAFDSFATNLVDGDTNGVRDVFVHDRASGTTERVSVASDGREADDASLEPSVSADGSRLAFSSDASNLAEGVPPATRQVYVRDRPTRTTSLVSTSADGAPAEPFGAGSARISSDGRFVTMGTTALNLGGDVDTNVNGDVFVKDLSSGAVERVSVATDGSPGNELSQCPAGSRNASQVVFASRAGNLVPADFNGAFDYFVRDRVRGRTERVNVSSGGAESIGMTSAYLCPLAISDDGRFVAFEAPAGDLAEDDTNADLDVFVHDRLSGSTERISLAADGAESEGSSHNVAISDDGRYVAFQGNGDDLVDGDENGAGDIYVYDRGPESGVGGAAIATTPHDVAVSGWTNFDGRLVANADDPRDANADRLGADLVAVEVVHDVERRSLAVTWRLHSLPGIRGSAVPVDGTALTRGVTALPGVLYGLRLGAPSGTYLLVGGRSVEGPLVDFALYRCGTVCEQVAEAEGSVGVTGDDARAVFPVESLGPLPLQLEELHAFSATGTPPTAADPRTWTDRATLGGAVVPTVTVAAALGDGAGEPPADAFSPGETSGDAFMATLPDGGRPEGVVWLRTCRDTSCAASAHAYHR